MAAIEPHVLRDLVLLCIGIVLGGGMNLIVQRVRLWLRQRDMEKALAAEIRHIARRAKKMREDALKGVIPMVSSGQRYAWSAGPLDTPIWDACLQQTHLVPLGRLPKLQAVYSLISDINRANVIVEKQFQEWGAGEGPDVPRGLLFNLQQVMGRCSIISEFKDIRCLNELPEPLPEN